MNKEIIVIILAPIIVFAWLWYRDKREAQKLSDKLNNNESR